ncbi:MAG: hypothetical protein FWG61_05925 [Firmicutes bacterium]|nr:hypothetical protein [Bacillota bacterium]
MKKKYLTILLVVVMTLSLVPIIASAAPIGSADDLTTINYNLLVTADEVQAWHEAKATFGPTDSGGPGWQKYYNFLTSAFEAKGDLVNKLEHSFQYDLFTIEDWIPGTPEQQYAQHQSVLGLTLDPEGDKVSIPVASFTMNCVPMVGGHDYTTAEMIYWDSSNRTAPPAGYAAGKILVVETQPYANPSTWGTSFWDSYTLTDYEYRTGPGPFPNLYEAVDPAVDNSWHTRWEFTDETTLRTWAINSGAVGMIIVSDLPWDTAYGLHQRTSNYNVPSLFLDYVNGQNVLNYIKTNPNKKATIKLIAHYERVTTKNVIYFLPGVNYGTDADEMICVCTHTDSMALTQENGALGVLALYKYFSNIPQSDRPKTLLIYIDNRHFMTGGEAAFPNDDLFAIYPELIGKCVASISLEHMGQLEGADRWVDGKFVEEKTGLHVYSFIGVPSNESIISTVKKAVDAAGLPRADVKCNSRPGSTVGGYQMSVKSMSNNFRTAGTALGKPYVNLAGNWPGSHTQIFASLSWFDAKHFVKQVAVMSQLTGYFMTADFREANLFWGQTKDAIRNLAATAVTTEDKNALMNQCDVIFDDVVAGNYVNAFNKLQILLDDVENCVANGTAKNNIRNYINRSAALLGVEPSISLSGDAVITGGEVARYAVNVNGVRNLSTATIWFEASNPYLTGKAFNGLNGFSLLGGVNWTQGGNRWTGRATFINMEGGITADKPIELCELLFSTSQEYLGVTEVKLTQFQLSGFNDAGEAIFIDADLTNNVVQTVIEKQVDKFDVNRDGKVDQLDLTTALLYYGAEQGDPNWDIAKRGDVNGDGCVDTEDLIMILNHIVW